MHEVSYTRTYGTKFTNWLSFNLTSTQTLKWTNQWGHDTTQGSGQSATLSITGPPYGYTGPTSVQVYKDNVYGTFMFAFSQ